MMSLADASAIHARIEQRLGFLPPFFASAADNPAVLSELWRQTESAYLDNPLPSLFKEKLGALLGTYCAVPYCLFCHTSSMRPLGMSGKNAFDVLNNFAIDLDRINHFDIVAETTRNRVQPRSEQEQEQRALECAVGLFLNINRQGCESQLRMLVGVEALGWILIFISYKRLCFDWSLMHPTTDYRADERVIRNFEAMCGEEPRLSTLLSEAFTKRTRPAARWLAETNERLVQEAHQQASRIAASEERFRTLTEVSPQIMWEADSQGSFTFLSQPWSTLTGRNVQDCLGEEWWKFVREPSAFHARWRAAVLSTTPFEFDLPIFCAVSMTYRWHLFRGRPTLSEDGGVHSWAGTLTDIDDLRIAADELSHTREQMHAAISMTRVGFFDWDIVADSFELNRQFMADWQVDSGINLNEIIQRVYEDDRPRVLGLIKESVRSGSDYATVYRISLPSGDVRWMDARGSITRNSEGIPLRFFGTAQDITDREEAKQAVEQQKLWLAAANEELKAEAALRERFVSALTHDLRNPIAALKINARLLLRDNLSDVKTQQIGRRIGHISSRAENMIRDLLDASRLKAGEEIMLELDDVELDSIAAEAVSELREVHGGRVLLRNSTQGIVGRWDRNAVQRVLDNLVGNAVKYGSPQEPITVFVTAEQGRVEFAVHNRGNVIPDEELSNLFKPYFRTNEAIKGGQKGWGIGLTLVKEIVERHRGRIWVKSSASEGTTFHVELPLASDAGFPTSH